MAITKPLGLISFILVSVIIAASAENGTTTAPSSIPSIDQKTDSPDPKPDPKPDPLPKDQELSFKIKDKNNVTCALFNFVGTIYLAAVKGQSSEQTIPITNLTYADTTKSKCGTDQIDLVLNVNNVTNQLLNLTLLHQDSSYKLDQVNFTLPVDASGKVSTSVYTSNDLLLKVDDGKSYVCSANPQIEFYNKNNVEAKGTMQFKKLKVDAFRTTNDEVYRTAVECEADFPTNDFVPLAVGCSLIALVFIVLVAYIVGRRRNRRLTYQSV